MSKHTLIVTILVLVLALIALPVLAQDSVTADEVNAIAKKLYCPVCENIPLDTCGTAACDDWRYEIQLQLEAGMTEQEIVDDFVARFGDRVVGTPQDPALRTMSLLTPMLLALGALIVVIIVLFQWRRGSRTGAQIAGLPNAPTPPKDDYRAQLERDLLELR